MGRYYEQPTVERSDHNRKPFRVLTFENWAGDDAKYFKTEAEAVAYRDAWLERTRGDWRPV